MEARKRLSTFLVSNLRITPFLALAQGLRHWSTKRGASVGLHILPCSYARPNSESIKNACCSQGAVLRPIVRGNGALEIQYLS